MRRLDESAVAATAGEIVDVMWIGKVCCNLIAACERVGDVERATQWCAEVKEFAQRWELRTLFNIVPDAVRRGAAPGGRLGRGRGGARAAVDAFAGGRRSALFEGTAQLGELRRRQGRLDEARSCSTESELSRTARIGSVELALDEGDPATALALAERLERTTAKSRPTRPVAVLACSCGRPSSAAASSRRSPPRPSSCARRRPRHDTGASDRGRTGGRRERLRRRRSRACAAAAPEDAADLFGLCESPYERARARLLLARVLAALGPAKRARTRRRARRARRSATSVRAARLSAAVRLLARPPAAGEVAGPLTRREREVLAARRRRPLNRQIAAGLVVSEHTVHRHVANILRKLAEPTRAAAAARATRDGLVEA